MLVQTKNIENNKDSSIGRKLRQFRNMAGLSQSNLANKTGVSFQQIQKYEKGTNRISAGRLHDFAEILNVDVQQFFQGLGDRAVDVKSRYSVAENDESSFVKSDIFESKETITLVREYYKITDAEKRRKIIELIKTMGD